MNYFFTNYNQEIKLHKFCGKLKPLSPTTNINGWRDLTRGFLISPVKTVYNNGEKTHTRKSKDGNQCMTRCVVNTHMRTHTLTPSEVGMVVFLCLCLTERRKGEKSRCEAASVLCMFEKFTTLLCSLAFLPFFPSSSIRFSFRGLRMRKKSERDFNRFRSYNKHHNLIRIYGILFFTPFCRTWTQAKLFRLAPSVHQPFLVSLLILLNGKLQEITTRRYLIIQRCLCEPT